MSADSKEYDNFCECAEHHIASGVNSEFACGKEDTSCFVDLAAARRRLNYALQSALETGEEALPHFARAFASDFNHILWVEDYEDMFAQMRMVFKQWDVRSVCFPQLKDANELNDKQKCPLYHELGLLYFLQDEKIEIEERGKVQIFHPDRLLTDKGMLLFNGLTNHAVSMLNNSNINLCIVTVNQLLNSTSTAELYGEFHRAYVQLDKGMQVLYRGTGKCTNYLIVIDNRRSVILGHKPCRAILACLQCGRCGSVCPVEQTAGKEAYDNIFTGPLASIMLPYLEDEEKEKHVVDACLMCGRCEEACPLQLPLRDMILYNRQDFLARDITEKAQHKLIDRMGDFLQSRTAMNKGVLSKKLTFGRSVSGDAKQFFDVPPFAPESFNKQETKK